MQTDPSIIEVSAGKKGNGAAPEHSGSHSALSREFHNFLDDVEHLIKETALVTGEDLEYVKTKLTQRISSAKESVEAMRGDIASQARKTVADTNEYVHQQPWKAIGISAGLGLLVGFAMTRRSS